MAFIEFCPQHIMKEPKRLYCPYIRKSFANRIGTFYLCCGLCLGIDKTQDGPWPLYVRGAYVSHPF